MTTLIDTDIAIDFLRGEANAVATMRTTSEAGVLLSVVIYIELVEGVLGSRQPLVRKAQLVESLTLIEICDLDQEIAHIAASIRLDLRSRGKEIRHRSLGLLIAATALSKNAKLATRNLKDYRDIPNIVFHSVEF